MVENQNQSINLSDRQICIAHGLLSTLVNLIGLIREQKPFSKQLVPEKTFKIACRLLQTLCSSNITAYIYMLLSNKISVLVDCLVIRFTISVANNRLFNHCNPPSTTTATTTSTTPLMNTTDQNLPASSSSSSTAFIEQQFNQDSIFFHYLSNHSCTLDILNCLTDLLNGLYELNYYSTEFHGTIHHHRRISSSSSLSIGTNGFATTTPTPPSSSTTSLTSLITTATTTTTTTATTTTTMFDAEADDDVDDGREHQRVRIDSQRIQDLISYIVSSGLVDLISSKLSNPKQAHWLSLVTVNSANSNQNNENTNNTDIVASSDSMSKQSIDYCQQFVLNSIGFLTSLTRLLGVLSMRQQEQSGEHHSHVTTVEQHHQQQKRQEISSGTVTSSCSSLSKSFIVIDPAVGSVDDQVLKVDENHPDSCQNGTTTVNCKNNNNNNSNNDTTTMISMNSLDKLNATKKDPTQLLETISSTEVFGLVPLLYCLLLDPKNSSRTADTTASTTTTTGVHDSRPTLNGIMSTSECSEKIDRRQKLTKTNKHLSVNGLPFNSEIVAQIILNTLKLINSLASIHQNTMQSILGGELICLLMRHILINLLTRCVPQANHYSIQQITSNKPPPTVHHSTTTATTTTTTKTAVTVRQPHQTGVKSKTSMNNNHKNNKIHHRVTANDAGNADDDDKDDLLLLPSGTRKIILKPKYQHSKTVNNNDMNQCKQQQQVTASTQQLINHSNKTNIQSIDNNKFAKLSSYTINELILHEVILCIGYLCVLNTDNQTSLQCGPSPNLLQRLLALPFEYFSYYPLVNILYPTLIVCCYQHELNTNVLQSEFSLSILANYIEERILERKVNSFGRIEKKSNTNEFLDERFNFEQRFNISEWNSAKAYFSR
ncbi:unnamed protein product [Schistosoma turkestanicum]|nr:unnamed protein product [Schistosoma turkestanicum]